MAIGLISVPSSWTNGTVAVPTWFQSVQDNINAFIGATESLKAVVIDGTGGASVTPTAGTLKLSATGTGTSAPTPSVTKGAFYASHAPFAFGVTNFSGPSLRYGFNVSSITKNATGDYTVTFLNSATNSNQMVALVTPMLAGSFVIATAATPTTTTLRWTTFLSTTGAANDCDVSFLVLSL